MTPSDNMLARVQNYIDHRRSLGLQLRIDAMLLLNFARYADSIRHRGPLTIDLAVKWATLPTEGAAVYRARRLDLIRRFATYQVLYEPRTEIPPQGLLGSTAMRPRPHIYSDEEISALVGAAQNLLPAESIRPRTYSTFLGLLACTGLRVGEALKLGRDDADLHNGVLTVRQTKFYKSRLVPLHPSATNMLGEYVRFRDAYHPVPLSGTFFLSEAGKALPYTTVCQNFQRIRDRLGWGADENGRVPRMYDLRHTFICRRLLTWYREGIDIDHAIYSLSVYVGHVKVTHTYWYVTGVPELLALAAKRFEMFAHQQKGGTQ
ncbi:tyrosine-type recombinase/integrase [Candidatus Sumerlaeota bacterium]